MQKIGDSTSTANGAKEFTKGQPGTGVDATVITAEWLNAIQRELVNLVLGGGLTIVPGDDSQVLKAIQAIQTAANTWAKLAGKPTTVAEFGLTDAFTKSETSTAIQQAVAALVASSPAALDTLKELADALGNDPNFATTMTNALAGKAGKATSLAGYGITDAYAKTVTYTKTEVEDLLAVQSTESRQGTAKVATQTLTDAGADDATIVTPKKLRWGVYFSFGANGYVAFPTWLGGWLIQWGSVADNVADAYNAPFPIAFPAVVYKVIPVMRASIDGSLSLNCYWDKSVTTLTTVRVARRYANNGGAVGTAAQGYEYIAIGK